MSECFRFHYTLIRFKLKQTTVIQYVDREITSIITITGIKVYCLCFHVTDIYITELYTDGYKTRIKLLINVR